MPSKKTQLCTEALVLIASAPAGVPVTTQVLSDRLSVSISHLESIMRLLREAGFVRSIRGPGGGYHLARPAREITLWAVFSGVGEMQDAPTGGPASSATRHLELALHQAVKDYLCSRHIGEFVSDDAIVAGAAEAPKTGFRLGPMPERWRPVAPNSVFQLSSFIHALAA